MYESINHHGNMEKQLHCNIYNLVYKWKSCTHLLCGLKVLICFRLRRVEPTGTTLRFISVVCLCYHIELSKHINFIRRKRMIIPKSHSLYFHGKRSF